MIQLDARYINNAHIISDVPLDKAVTELFDGQFLMMKADGTMTKHDGSTGKRGYMTISSKYGNPVNNIGQPITAPKNGRDNVTSTGLVAVLIGPYRLGTDQYEVGTYTPGAPLKVSASAKLTPWVAGTDKAEDIVGYVWTAPAAAGALMTVIHE
jgi:hypothetical protein